MSKGSIREQQAYQAYTNDDEITLKELILKLQEFWQELWKQKFWIAAVGFSVAGIFVYNALTTPPTYPATLTFMVNEDGSRGGGGVSSILGQFGFGGGGKGGKFNLDKIVKLTSSRNIVQGALFSKTVIDEKEDYIANHIIRVYELKEKWRDGGMIPVDFIFSHDSISQFDIVENKVLKSVHALVVGSEDGIMSQSYDKDTGILSLSANSQSEVLSIQVVHTIYARLSDYYISRAIEPQQKTYNAIKSKTDSLRTRLRSLTYQQADYQDRNLDVLFQRDVVKKQELGFEQTATAKAYAEALKNLELADFTLKNKTPAFQIIDAPIVPLSPSQSSLVKSIAIGGILGGFLAVLFFVIRKIIRDAMSE